MHVHQPLEVFQLSTLAELASLRTRWNELAGGIPMRSWEWFEGWWRVYGNTSSGPSVGSANGFSRATDKELYLLAVFEAPDRLVAIAPWYIEHSADYGRTLRFLGAGEICTDYSTILCEPGQESAAIAAIARLLSDPLHVADWLTQNSVRHWDRIEFDAIPRDDRIMQQLFAELERHNNLVHRRQTMHCWQVTLPKTWPDYLAMLSKSHRKQVRRFQREYFATERATVHWVDNDKQFDDAWDLLVRLHQERQRSRGGQGCFISPGYSAFHRDLAQELLRAGTLWLGWLELDGRPLAVEYGFVGEDTVFAYQGGIDPAGLEFSPGQMILMASLERAIAEGFRSFDFLRGDESYKPHWRAQGRPIEDIRIVKRTPANHLRKGLWVASDQLKDWFKSTFRATSVSY